MPFCKTGSQKRAFLCTHEHLLKIEILFTQLISNVRSVLGLHLINPAFRWLKRESPSIESVQCSNLIEGLIRNNSENAIVLLTCTGFQLTVESKLRLLRFCITSLRDCPAKLAPLF